MPLRTIDYEYKGKAIKLVTTDVVTAGELEKSGDINHFVEVSATVLSKSVFDGRITGWLDAEIPHNWRILKNPSNRIIDQKISKGRTVQLALLDLPDGKHVLRLDVDHPEDEQWNGYIVVDDDTLKGVNKVSDVDFENQITITFTTKKGVVVKSSGVESPDQKAGWKVPSPKELSDFFGSAEGRALIIALGVGITAVAGLAFATHKTSKSGGIRY